MPAFKYLFIELHFWNDLSLNFHNNRIQKTLQNFKIDKILIIYEGTSWGFMGIEDEIYTSK